jgi:hypothetical protein
MYWQPYENRKVILSGEIGIPVESSMGCKAAVNRALRLAILTVMSLCLNN